MNNADDPIATLKMRLARGEISPEEYRLLHAELSAGSGSASPARSTPAGGGTTEDFFVKADEVLGQRGYLKNEKGEIMKVRDDGPGRRVAEVIGTREGWFRPGAAFGVLILLYIAVGAIAGLISWLLGSGLDQSPAFVRTLLGWLPLVLWGLWLWSVRSDYKEYEAELSSVYRELNDR